MTCRACIAETILVRMSTASVSDLRANLSRYLREVRSGGEVEVLDRGTSVARLVPPATGVERGVRKRLIDAGLLRPGKGNAAAILESPPLALPVSLSEALADERAGRSIPVKLPTGGHGGLQPGVTLDSNAALLEAVDREP